MGVSSSNVSVGSPPLASQYNNLRNDVIGEQGHDHRSGQGAPVVRLLSGTNSDRQGMTPQVGWVFVTTDTTALYVCYSAGTWTNITDHATLDNVTTDQHHAKLHNMDSTADHAAGSITPGQYMMRTSSGWAGMASGTGGGIDVDMVDGEHVVGTTGFYHGSYYICYHSSVYNCTGYQETACEGFDGSVRFKFNGRGKQYKLSAFLYSTYGGNYSLGFAALYNITDGSVIVSGSEASGTKAYSESGSFTLPDGEKLYSIYAHSSTESYVTHVINARLIW